ncbi:MAG: hypothetical protein ACREV4_07855 [Gammaproteobacteria bacterium]
MKRTWGISSFYSAIASAVVLFTGVASAPQAFGADPLSTRVQELEQQLEQMQAELKRLKQEAQEPSVQVHKLDDRMSRVEESVSKQAEVTPVSTREVTELEERVARVERVDKYKNSTIFFRGGYTNMDDDARGFESFTDTHNTLGLGQTNPALGGPNNADDGWYVGGSIEHSITTDLWGLMPGTEALGEISLEYKNFGTERQTVVVPSAEVCLLFPNIVTSFAGGDTGCVVRGDIALTMFTVSASPKIKFMEGSPLRPWIIPAGLDFHVISPPSDSATYLDVGVQFAAGVEYEVLPGVVLGIDGRYHLTTNYSNSDNDFSQVLQRETGLVATGVSDHEFNFWTAGAYAGFRF